MSSRISVILVDQQVDRGFPEANIIRRLIMPAEGCRVDIKRPISVLHVTVDNCQPGLDDVVFRHDAIIPTAVSLQSSYRS